MCQKAYSASPSIEERRAGRTSSLRESSRSVSVTSVRSRSPICATAPAQKTLPTTAASASIDFVSADERVQAGGDQGLDRVGERDLGPFAQLPARALLDEQVLVLQQPHELLGVERVAAGPVQDRLLELGGDHGRLQQRRDEARGLLLGERREVDRGGVAQPVGVVGMALEQLGAGGADHEQRHPLGPVREVLEEREHRVVGPVQVLEHEHGGVLLGDVLEEPSPGGEQLLALGGGGRLDPEQRQQALAEPGALVAFGEHRLELRRRDLGCVGLQDPGVGLQDLPERPEGDAFPVGQAPSLAPGDELGLGVDVAEQLGDDPALAEPGFPDHGDELG